MLSSKLPPPRWGRVGERVKRIFIYEEARNPSPYPSDVQDVLMARECMDARERPHKGRGN